MLSLLPTWHLFRRLMKLPRREVKDLATRTWQIAPAETTTLPPAFFLPGQLERVTGYQFANDDYCREMHGGYEINHAPTMGYLIKQALLVDGVLLKKDSSTFLTPRCRLAPSIVISSEIERGALYGTWGGLRYFGQWLIDDCVTYSMACDEGIPITVAQQISDHTATYEHLLDMEPCRVNGAFFHELIVFDDYGQNRHKSARFRALTDKLSKKIGITPHAGVFVLRGKSGTRRVLRNELELAEHLRMTRGFRIVDPMSNSVSDILSACSGSQVVVGVEGSHLVHAVMMLSPGSSLLTIQPPFRFCTVLKDVANRDGLKFGFVIGQAVENDFIVEPDEVEQTLDLMLAT